MTTLPLSHFIVSGFIAFTTAGAPKNTAVNAPSATINHLNTPFNNQVAKEITVTDPTHPLFGKTFPVSSFSSTAYKGGNVSVIYRDNITLHIPFFSTNLASKQDFLTSKLTWTSLYEFVSIAKEYKLCHVNHVKCGRKCCNVLSQKF